MIVLGISSDFHDSSACLVKDGVPLVTAAEERFSYQKHDSGFPELAIKSCLRWAGVQPEEIDFVAYHEEPVVKFSRIMASRLQGFPFTARNFARTVREIVLGQLWVKLDIFRATGVSADKIHMVPHHLSHATYAFSAANLPRAAILVIDAVGEWTSTSLFSAERGDDGNPRIQLLDAVPYPHSLGMVYSAFTAFLGFRVNESENSTMALASFGTPRFAGEVRKIIRAESDGLYSVDPDYFDFSVTDRPPLSRKFYSAFGPARSNKDKLSFACVGESSPVDPRMQHYADVAASIQTVLEEIVFALAARAKRLTGVDSLCLAGGVALNCSMNGRLIRESGFKNVFIPPDPGDGGGALGAALYVSAKFGAPARKGFGPYLGLDYSGRLQTGDLARLEIHEILQHRSKAAVKKFGGFKSETPGFAAIAERVSEKLARGQVIGWFQGRFENGPRALGNRSLLVDPRNAEATRRLSRQVKLRAPFRPYACSLNEEKASVFFDFKDGVPAGTRWMSSAHPVRPQAREFVSEALHVDGTTRPQILARAENQKYHDLISAWEARSGCPALLNTSFNESGYPLVSSPVDAILAFLRTDIDALVVDDVLIEKV
jgi:carbamoyltransferase